MNAGHKVLMVVDNNILLIVGNPKGILYQPLRPHPFYTLNITILINQIELHIIKFFQKLRTFLSEGGSEPHPHCILFSLVLVSLVPCNPLPFFTYLALYKQSLLGQCIKYKISLIIGKKCLQHFNKCISNVFLILK